MASRTAIIVLPWSPTHQGGVTAVVQQIIEHWPIHEKLTPMLAVDDWNAHLPEKTNSAIHFRFAIFGNANIIALTKALLRAPITIAKTYKFLHEYNAAAINFHYPGLLPVGVAFLKIAGLFKGRLVLSYHGTDVHPPRDWLERTLQRFLITTADAIIACSAGLAKRMHETWGVTASNISIIHNGVNASVFHPNAQENRRLTTALPSYYIVNIGSFLPIKSQHTLIKAFSHLSGNFPGLHLCLAGARGSEQPVLQEMACRLKLADRIHFFQDLSQKEVAHLLAHACLCVQTSISESMPLAVLESGAAGVPIVASRIRGHKEFITDGCTGRLFSVEDSDDCTRVIAEVLMAPHDAASMAASFRSIVLDNFTWERCTSNYLRIYLS